MVTNMPYWAEKIGVPRTLAVEFPYGHILGQRHDTAQQRRVLRMALDVLRSAKTPGTIVHFQEVWSESLEEAIRECHPDMPPPIMAHMSRHMGSFLRGLRRAGR
jgi:hypothetical protein